MPCSGSKIVANSNPKPPNAGKGRPKGAKNKTTVAMKDAMMAVYADLQAKRKGENGHFLEWAEENPTEFYKLASKLLPIQVSGAGEDGEHVHEIRWKIVGA